LGFDACIEHTSEFLQPHNHNILYIHNSNLDNAYITVSINQFRKSSFTVNDTSDNIFVNGEKLPLLLIHCGTLTIKIR
jgi:hypothetical protein